MRTKCLNVQRVRSWLCFCSAARAVVACTAHTYGSFASCSRLRYTPCQDHALGAFGLQRVMYESNWFVPAAFGGKAEKYDKTFGLVKGALTRAGASADEVKAVFNANAKRVYRL